MLSVFLNNALLYNAQMMINNGLILFSFFEMLMLLSLSLLFVFSGRRVDDSSGDFGDVEMVSARTTSVRKSAIWMFRRRFRSSKSLSNRLLF